MALLGGWEWCWVGCLAKMVGGRSRLWPLVTRTFCCCGVGLRPAATRDGPYFSGGPLDGGSAVGVMEVCGAALPRY